ncbi:MAG: PDZ domain-containing protein [Cyanobacteria bacterium P01_F01_bin.150]
MGTVAIASIIGILTVRAFNQLNIAKTATRLEQDGNIALQQMKDAPLESLVKLWSSDGELIAEMAGHVGPVWDVNFNRNGDRLITSGEDGTVRIWDLDGQELKTFLATSITSKETSGFGISFAWEEDAKAIAIVSVLPNSPAEDAGLKAGDRITTINDQNLRSADDTSLLFDNDVISIEIERSGSSSFSRTIERRSYTSEAPTALLSAIFSVDEQQIITGDAQGYIRCWSLTGEKLFEIKAYDSAIVQIVLSPSKTEFLSVSRQEPAKLWSLDGTLQLELPVDNQNFVRRADFSPDGQTIVAVGDTIQLWTIQGKELQRLQGHTDLIFGVDFGPDGQTLATSGLNGIVRLWDLKRQDTIRIQAHDGRIYDAEFSPDSQKILTVGVGEGAIPQLWTTKGKKIDEFEQSGFSGAGQFSPDGQYILLANTDGTTRLWTVTGETVAVMKGYRGSVTDAVFHPQEERVATAGQDGTVRVWNFSGDELLRFTASETARAYSVDFSSDGHWMATAGQDGLPRLWTADGQPLAELVGHEGGVDVIRFSPNDQYLVTAGQDRTVRLWNSGGEAVKTLRGHQGKVTDVDFSPDGQTILSSGSDGTVRLWTLARQQIAEYRFPEKLIMRVSYSADGQNIAIGKDSGEVEILPIADPTLGDLLNRGCDWLDDYLRHNSSVTEDERSLCPRNKE